MRVILPFFTSQNASPELAVVALLIDRITAAAVDQHAILGVGDDLFWRG